MSRIDLRRIVPLVVLCVILSGCDGRDNPFASSQSAEVEYRPGEAGTVDHALCLLGFVNVPIRNVRPGHQLVEARINGVIGDFLLDTGANVTVVSAVHAKRFGLSQAGGGILSAGVARIAGASGAGRQVRVDSFTLGNIDIRQRRVLVADLGPLLEKLGDAAGREVYGIIGQDVMNEHRAVIDVARPMLHMQRDESDPAPVASARCEPRG